MPSDECGFRLCGGAPVICFRRQSCPTVAARPGVTLNLPLAAASKSQKYRSIQDGTRTLKISSGIDILLSPLAVVGALASVPVSRRGPELPYSRSIFDHLKVYPIRHHYYTPLVYQSDLRVPLARERVINGLDLNEKGQLDLLEKFDFRDELTAISRFAVSSLTFGYDNHSFEVGDARYQQICVEHLSNHGSSGQG